MTSMPLPSDCILTVGGLGEEDIQKLFRFQPHLRVAVIG